MNGIILVDKPVGWSSFDVVAKVRATIKKELGYKIKIGHTGTLDPEASGLLILVVGSYTKQAQTFSKLDKTYEVTMRLGQESTTGDAEGKKTTISAQQPTRAELTSVIQHFVGQIEQVPPVYSAIKVNGQRSYALARAGKAVDLAARLVTIHSLTISQYCYPDVMFTSRVSSGTYIRSLVSDIGAALKTGAYTEALRRTQVGIYNVHDALTIEQLNIAALQAHLRTG